LTAYKNRSGNWPIRREQDRVDKRLIEKLVNLNNFETNEGIKYKKIKKQSSEAY
jgi:hypothetical protein